VTSFFSKILILGARSINLNVNTWFQIRVSVTISTIWPNKTRCLPRNCRNILFIRPIWGVVLIIIIYYIIEPIRQDKTTEKKQRRSVSVRCDIVWPLRGRLSRPRGHVDDPAGGTRASVVIGPRLHRHRRPQQDDDRARHSALVRWEQVRGGSMYCVYHVFVPRVRVLTAALTVIRWGWWWPKGDRPADRQDARIVWSVILQLSSMNPNLHRIRSEKLYLIEFIKNINYTCFIGLNNKRRQVGIKSWTIFHREPYFHWKIYGWNFIFIEPYYYYLELKSVSNMLYILEKFRTETQLYGKYTVGIWKHVVGNV